MPAPWPSPGDYTAAVQNPPNCFADPELQAGRIRTNHLGLPVGASGSFAVVYSCVTRTATYAVRCFLFPVVDQEARYAALSRHLEGFSLPSLVRFSYLREGIRTGGSRYPMVKMEWVAGEQLSTFVGKHRTDPAVLTRLAGVWRGAVAGLVGAHIAHGDLQHGNILVDLQGSLRLVDYDGFYLPELAGNAPGEVGHANYQHPERLERGHYGENADAFPALVIYLSLLALAADESLWNLHTYENLIFVKEDFKDPSRTSVWQRLQASPSPNVRRLSYQLADFCRQPVTEIPDLESVIQSLPRRAAASARPAPPVFPPARRTPAAPVVPSLKTRSSQRSTPPSPWPRAPLRVAGSSPQTFYRRAGLIAVPSTLLLYFLLHWIFERPLPPASPLAPPRAAGTVTVAAPAAVPETAPAPVLPRRTPAADTSAGRVPSAERAKTKPEPRVPEVNPKVAAIRGLLARERFGEAARAAEDFLRAEPGNGQAQKLQAEIAKVLESRVSASLQRAGDLFEQGRLAEAVQECDRALQLDPDHQQVLALKARVARTMEILSGRKP